MYFCNMKIFEVHTVIFCLLFFISAQVRSAEVSDTFFLEQKETFDISELGGNLDVAVTKTGEVFLVSPLKIELMHLHKGSRTVAPVQIKGIHEGYCFHPTSVEADGEGRLWIANPDMHEILVCDSDGNLLLRFSREHLELDRPESLFSLTDGKIGVWDSRLNTLSMFSLMENRVRMRKISSEGKLTCIRNDAGDAICLHSDRESLMKIQDGEIVAERLPDADKEHLYVKISHLEIGPGKYLYVTDYAAGQIRYYSSDLKPEGRFYIHEPLFLNPANFTFRNRELWLVDEGRKTLMHFTVRAASSGMEHLVLAEEYLALGHFLPALGEISAAKSLGIQGADSEMISGISFYRLKRYPEALNAFTEAQKAGAVSANFYMGLTLFQLQRFAEAETAFGDAMKNGIRRHSALFNLAQTCMALNRFKDAETFFTRLLSEKPDDLQARSGLAGSLMKQRHYQQAAELLIPLTEQKGIGRTARHDLGICYLRIGRLEDAIALLKRAAAEGPFYKEAFRGLEEAFRMTGDTAEAAEYREKAARLRQDQWFVPYLLEETEL